MYGDPTFRIHVPAAQHIRLDRILDEAQATGGDVRALCDLFGMSVGNASRYATAIDRITPAPEN